MKLYNFLRSKNNILGIYFVSFYCYGSTRNKIIHLLFCYASEIVVFYFTEWSEGGNFKNKKFGSSHIFLMSRKYLFYLRLLNVS